MFKRTLSGIFLVLTVPAFAATITVDENGHGNADGSPLGLSLAADPGPGGASSVLTYNLPFAGVQGDVVLFDPNLGFPGDVVRFNGNGTMAFYSDNVAGIDSLADTLQPPSAPYTNTIVINETGPVGNNSATYTPGIGDPGYDTSHPTYVLSSDATPEPATLALMGFGLALFGGTAAIRKKTTR